MKKRTIIIGTIGADAHIVGAQIMTWALQDAGFNVVNLGGMIAQQEFIDAAIETKADAILISSLYGMGILDCEGFRDKCQEAGLGNILLYAGGILTTEELPWEELNRRFKKMGFDRVFPPETSPKTAITALKEDLKLK